MNLAGEMEFNIRIILPLGIEEPFALCQVNRVAVLVFTGIALFKAQEIFQFFLVFAGKPACLIKRQCSEFAGCAIFVQQAVLDHFKLQFTHATNNLFGTAKLGE